MGSLSDDDSDDDNNMIGVDIRGQSVRLRRLLEDMIIRNDLDDAQSMLEKLSRLKVTKEIIETTNLGITVNKLRKLTAETDKSLSDKARQLIVNWRKLIPTVQKESQIQVQKMEVDEEEEESSSPETKILPQRGMASTSFSELNLIEPSPSSSSKNLVIRIENPTKPTTVPLKRKRKTKEPQEPVKEEIDWRERARKMILRRIEGKGFGSDYTEDLDFPKDAKNAKELAKDLEEEIFNLYGIDRRNDYNECVRSKTFNISDPNNPKLRENFLLGIISPQKLAIMNPQEMASDDLKKRRSKWWKEGIQDSLLAVSQSSNSSLLKCNKCGKNECSYNQLQTRSADEPMTTFASCNACGHRWKF